jgi:hypothetical protein
MKITAGVGFGFGFGLCGLFVLGALSTVYLRADEAACERILQANKKTGSSGVSMKSSGYAFAGATPEIYGTGAHTCSHVRDEVVDGQAAEVYRERYESKKGSTDALIWISKSTGRVLREEQDGEVPGKGKGHISYAFPSAGATKTEAAAAANASADSSPASGAVRKDGKLPMYPHAHNMNDIPASAIEIGVPMVLETGDSVTAVDGWYRINASKSCTRTTADKGVKYACPGAGDVMIYPHEGKTQIAFVPTMSRSLVEGH